MTRIVVHIGELVLSGFRREDRGALAEGLRAELTRQFAAAGVARDFAARGDVARLNAGTIRVAPDAKPAAVGTRAAQRIVGGGKP